MLKSVTQESCNLTGAGQSECVLSIVPVKVQSKKSEHYVKTYAYLDPGSTATFCTKDLQKKLDVRGKPTQILLSTMRQDKPGKKKLVKTQVLSGLEVCGLEDIKHIDLPKVNTRSSIPVDTENIPRQSDIQQWPYLSGVRQSYKQM